MDLTISRDLLNIEITGRQDELQNAADMIDRELDILVQHSNNTPLKLALESLYYDLRRAGANKSYDPYTQIDSYINHPAIIKEFANASSRNREHAYEEIHSYYSKVILSTIEAGYYVFMEKWLVKRPKNSASNHAVESLLARVKQLLRSQLSKKQYDSLLNLYQEIDHSEIGWLYLQWLSYELKRRKEEHTIHEFDPNITCLNTADQNTNIDNNVSFMFDSWMSYTTFFDICDALKRELRVDDLCLDEIICKIDAIQSNDMFN